jgi:hypothetical protein
VSTIVELAVLRHLIDLHTYDFSEFMDLDVGEDGPFSNHNLAPYWTGRVSAAAPAARCPRLAAGRTCRDVTAVASGSSHGRVMLIGALPEALKSTNVPISARINSQSGRV